MEQRRLGRSGLEGEPTGPGDDDLGPRHRRARGGRPALDVPRGGRHAGRHRGRLRRRRVRAGDRRRCWPRRSTARRSSSPRRPASRGVRASGSSTPRAGPCSTPWTARCSGSAPTTSTSGRCTPGATRPRWRRRSARWTTRCRRGGRATSGSRTTPAGRPGTPWVGRRRAGRAPLVSTQMEYSLLQRGIEREVLPAAAALGLGVLAWSPLGSGVLTGKYRTGTPADSRLATPHFGARRRAAPGRAQPRDRRRGRDRRRRARGDRPGGRAGVGA